VGLAVAVRQRRFSPRIRRARWLSKCSTPLPGRGVESFAQKRCSLPGEQSLALEVGAAPPTPPPHASPSLRPETGEAQSQTPGRVYPERNARGNELPSREARDLGADFHSSGADICVKVARNYFVTTLHTTFPTSSATSNAPRRSIATPTGRPRACPSSERKLVSTSIASPAGRPFANGTKITR
jgi:hypothetical protein